MPRFALVTLSCTHQAKYDIPHPRLDALAWCYRCQLFREVTASEPGPEVTTEVPTGYSKRVELTEYSGIPIQGWTNRT